MKEIINCKVPMRFPLKPNNNGICFTKESLKSIKETIENTPIVQDKKVIGVLSNTYDTFETEEEVTFIVDSKLYTECLPEVIIEDIEEIDGVKVIKSFKFMGASL